jgi:S-adenosylmethionine synthetase
VSGKTLVIDAYGPRAPIGNDFFKADRAGAILARRLAKLVGLTRAAKSCTAKLVFLPGAEQAQVASLEDESNSPLDPHSERFGDSRGMFRFCMEMADWSASF